MILVTTIGTVGAEAARILAAGDEPVRVLARHPEKATALSRSGVEVVAGDLADPTALDTALRGVRSVVLVSPAVPEQELAVVDHAVRAGVEHVVTITSVSSSDSPVPRRRGQARIEQGLIDSGLGFTLLKNNASMQNLLQLAPQIAATDRFGSAAGDGRVAATPATWRPSPRRWPGIRRPIETAPTGRAARSGSPTATRPRPSAGCSAAPSPTCLTVDEQRAAMIRAGMPEPLAAMNAQALGLFAQGDSDWTTDDVQAVTGAPPTTLEQFVRDSAPAFG